MPEIAVTVNGRSYRVSCGAGEEQRLQTLARGLDERVQKLVRSAGQAGEAQLLVAAGLLLADELDELGGELARLRAAPPVPAPAPVVDKTAERQATALIENLAQRIEAIAEQLERA
ncbi:MAG: cell division protein ZapA [Proteobacteria bacterium]|nr:cell division protein ZapA [Pseudomonadota bacterium]